MSRDRRAVQVAELLGIGYAHSLRLTREVRANGAYDTIQDLTLACRELMEKQIKKTRSALPKGAGAVRCIPCGAEARADGKGSPIVIHHADDCPERFPIKDHLYDAGFPRDDSRGCISNVFKGEVVHGSPEYEACGRSLSEHAKSEYPEDGR